MGATPAQKHGPPGHERVHLWRLLHPQVLHPLRPQCQERWICLRRRAFWVPHPPRSEHIVQRMDPLTAGAGDLPGGDLSLDKEDIKFATAASDKITALKDHKEKVKPVFLYYKKGALKKTIEGVNGPELMKLCDNIG